MKDELAALEVKVGEAATRLAYLRQANQRLRAKVSRLERDLAAAGGTAPMGQSARRAVRRRLEGLVRQLEQLLEP